jgi:O-acetyl-ADP-ribose deacetylase (regulator of RNase III)
MACRVGFGKTVIRAKSTIVSSDNWKFVCSKNISSQIKIELWSVRDILINLPDTYVGNDTLINSGNPKLSGARLPYFPKGGPVPEWEVGLTSIWGGMEAGPGMLYPSQSVDGRVHTEGGAAMKAALQRFYVNGCQVGQAVYTPATEQLCSKYHLRHVIHTVPPLSCTVTDRSVLPTRLITSYRSALDLFMQSPDMRIAAMPLIGSGAAGFSHSEAAHCLLAAITACSERPLQISQKDEEFKTVRIAVLGFDTASIVNDVVMSEDEASIKNTHFDNTTG